MMLAGPTLRVVPITIHIPFAAVPAALTVALIRSRAHATVRGLRRLFGIAQPRLAMCGLNPHAGEDGHLGREEIEVITPALEGLRPKGSTSAGRIRPTPCSARAPAPAMTPCCAAITIRR